MNLDAYRLALDGTSRHKMRALSLLAEGTAESRFEAAVMLHDVARAEQRAVRALERVSDEVQLAAAIERCWCLMEGLDPRAAANAWGDVLTASTHLPQANAMRARLEPKFNKMRVAYANALGRAPSLQRLREGRAKLVELDALLGEFPGSSWSWFMRSTLTKNEKDEWRFLRKAVRLEPADNRFIAGSLRIANRVLTGDDLREFLDATRSSLGSATADVCLFYAIAEIELARSARGSKRRESLARAYDASIDGESKEPSIPHAEPGLRQALHAVRLVTTELLADRKPNVDVLYQSGLGALAVEAQRGGDLMALIRDAVSSRFAA